MRPARLVQVEVHADERALRHEEEPVLVLATELLALLLIPFQLRGLQHADQRLLPGSGR